ncbi:hypothetical protein B0H14DRAFT_2629259 [Mycena olivaceomarginata]|nr:hypothetical protein B0H14DRAFT_2629259 [Mycena olivaceomarginata]
MLKHSFKQKWAASGLTRSSVIPFDRMARGWLKGRKTADIRAKKKQWKAKEKRRIDEEYRRLHAAWEKKREHMRQQGKRGGWGHPSAKPKRGPTPDRFREDGDKMIGVEGSDDEGAGDRDEENTSSDESGEFSVEGSDLESDLESEEEM